MSHAPAQGSAFSPLARILTRAVMQRVLHAIQPLLQGNPCGSGLALRTKRDV